MIDKSYKNEEIQENSEKKEVEVQSEQIQEVGQIQTTNAKHP